MNDTRSDTKTPEHFVNTAIAPRWLGTLARLMPILMAHAAGASVVSSNSRMGSGSF